MTRELLKRKTNYQRSAVLPFWPQRDDHSEYSFAKYREKNARDPASAYCFTSRGGTWKEIYLISIIHQVPVVQRLDNAIHWINRYPLDSDLSIG